MARASAILTIRNDRGLHTRPSTELVKTASHFRSQIQLKYRKQQVNAKSLLGIMMLAAPKGAKIRVTAEGEDSDAAVAALLDLASQSFHIKY